MCRNIRVLSNFQPPTTLEEMQAAAPQYVRKISGMRAPSQSNQASFAHRGGASLSWFLYG